MVGNRRALEAPKGCTGNHRRETDLFCRMLCRKQDEGWQGAIDLWGVGVRTAGVPASFWIDAIFPFPAVVSFLRIHAIIKIICHAVMISEQRKK